MAFTDAEMAVLSQLAYYGSDPGQPQPCRGEQLYSTLTNEDTRKYLMSKLGDGYAAVYEGLLDKTKNADYEIVKAQDDNKGSGFAAIAIKDPENNVTVAARGTQGFNVISSDASRRDVAADAELAFLVSTPQQEQMEQFVRDLEKEDYDGYYFTGHSLGGNLANYGAITLKPSSKMKGAVTFNAPGFNEAVLSKHAAEIAAIYNRVNNYQNEYDYVSSIMFVPGQITIVESSKDGGHLGFDDHGLSCLQVDGDGFEAKAIQVKSIQTVAFHNLIETLRLATGIKGYTLLVGVVEMGINLGRMAVSSFAKLFNWITNRLSGHAANSYTSFLQVNTGTMNSYADRLRQVNTRISRLDRRMDTLYGKVGFQDLWNLLQADLLTGYSWRLTQCANYLSDTAADFESVERTLVNQL